MASLAIVAVQLVLVAIIFVLYIFTERKWLDKISLYLPPSTLMMLIGIIFGGFFELYSEAEDAFAFNPDIFFNVLLPPIIFYGGFILPKSQFFGNLGSIMVFAIIGTFVSSLVIGSLVWAVGGADDTSLSFVDAMVLGSLLAAVDPVSTISVFRRSGVRTGLYTLVFGESVINDAAAVIANRVFVELSEDEDKQAGTEIAAAFGWIFLITIGSVVVGGLLAIGSALIHKHSRLRNHPPLELAAFLSVAYLSFILAEELHLSGIMSTLTCAILMDHYTIYNVSKPTASSVTRIFHMLSELAEAFVFVYLGMATFTFNGHEVNALHILFTFLWCLVSRAVSVFPLTWIVNRGRKRKITTQQTTMMWLSGLRGAVAFALAIDSPAKNRDLMVSTTLVIVFITTIAIGGLTYPVLKLLRLTKLARQSTITNMNASRDPYVAQHRKQIVDQRAAEADANVPFTSESFTGVNSMSVSQRTRHWFVMRDRESIIPFLRVPTSISEINFPDDLTSSSSDFPVPSYGLHDEHEAQEESFVRKQQLVDPSESRAPLSDDGDAQLDQSSDIEDVA